jgi:hypothetical protein
LATTSSAPLAALNAGYKGGPKQAGAPERSPHMADIFDHNIE